MVAIKLFAILFLNVWIIFLHDRACQIINKLANKNKNRLRQLHYLRSFVFYDYEYEFKNKMSPCSWLVHDHFLSVLDGQAWITFSSHLWTNQYSLPTHIHTSVCIWHNQSCFIAIYDFFFQKRVLLCIECWTSSSQSSLKLYEWLTACVIISMLRHACKL